jgi:hypothetical protein
MSYLAKKVEKWEKCQKFTPPLSTSPYFIEILFEFFSLFPLLENACSLSEPLGDLKGTYSRTHVLASIVYNLIIL